MIQGDPGADPPRKPWARRYVNSQVGRIRHVFKWAASHERVPVSVYQSLCTVEPLRRGRSAARETEPVRSVPEELLRATLPHLSRPSANCIWRWCRRGVLSRGGERVRLQHVRIGGRVYTTARWLEEFGRRLAEADAKYFDLPLTRRTGRRPAFAARTVARSASRRVKGLCEAAAEAARAQEPPLPRRRRRSVSQHQQERRRRLEQIDRELDAEGL